MVDFKQINEDLISFVEKTIDPKFRDAIEKVQKQRLDKMNKELEDPNTSDWRKQDIEQHMKIKHDAKNVYKALASKGLDVEKATIQFIGTGAELDGKILKKILKEKMDKEDYNNGPNRVFLIMDQHHESSNWRADYDYDGTGISIWSAYYQGGKFFLDDYVPVRGFAPVCKGRILMADLNAKANYTQKADFYIAFGVSSNEIRKQRRDNKAPQSLDRAKNPDDWYNRYDKSGYDLKAARDALSNRLKEYKKNNGTYAKRVEELTGKLDEMLPKVNEILSNIDFNQGIEKPQNVMKAARKAAVAIKEITSSADSKWYDDDSMKSKIIAAEEALYNLENLL